MSKSYFTTMPIDRTIIRTRLRINPNFFDDPVNYIQRHGLQVRTTKISPGFRSREKTRNLTLKLLNYKGIKVDICDLGDDELMDVTIQFNPTVCLYGHNGFVLTLTEFFHALGLLVTHLSPLLQNSDDWVDLIPGLREGGVAYWNYLEIILQCEDSDGSLLARFRNLKHPAIKTPARHWETSIGLGGKRSMLSFSIYQKAAEMVEHGKLEAKRLQEYRHILRFEVRMKGEKLVHYLGNERNVEEIDGVRRLVRFYPDDIVCGHRNSFSEMVGVYNSGKAPEAVNPRDQLTPLGQLLARVALDNRTSQTFQELLACVQCYTGAGSETMGKIKRAGIAYLSSQSIISKDEVFSDAAYQAQPGIPIETLEQMVLHDLSDTAVNPKIYRAYQPPTQPYRPLSQWPTYLRV